MTEPSTPRNAAWSRRRVLRSLTLPALPLPLLALDGCGENSASRKAGGSGRGASGPTGRTPPAPHAVPGSGTASAHSAGSDSTSSPEPPTDVATPEVSHASHVSDAVALTFHGDGPPALATALLAEAERNGAQLTVLAVGHWLARYPEMAERVLHGGHELGNHTENHLAIDRMPESIAYREIELCAARLEKLTGSRGRWFRQSQGQHASPEVRAAAQRAGYTTLLSYDVDPLDYRDPGSNAVAHNVLSRIQGGDVVSMHLGHPGTVTALPLILDGLRQRGLRPVTASELFPISPPGGVVPS